MSLTLRIVLIILSVIFIIYVVSKVNRRKLQLQFSLIWLLIATVLILIALFPQIVYFAATLVGIETSSNLVYLIGIVSLLFLSINMTIRVSKQSGDIKNIVQTYALNCFLEEQKNENK